MIPALLFVLLLAAPLRAELTLSYLEPGDKETPVGNRITAPQTVSGEFSDVLLRVRNTGSSNETITAFYASGSGFRLLSVGALPALLPAGRNMDVRLRFEPTGSGSYSGTLFLNTTAFFLSGRSPEAATLWYERGGWQQVTNSGEVDFGRILANTTSTLLFALRNPSSFPVRVSSLLLPPGPFSLVNVPPLPYEIPAAGELRFSIEYTPLRGGVFRANLLLDQRTFVLAGNAYEPPLPELSLVFPSAVYASAQQQAFQVRFTTPMQGNAVIRLGLAFEPLNGMPDDPAVLFLANGARALTLQAKAGDETLTWNGDPNLLFQTGTTAGRLRFTLTHETTTRTADFVIPPAPPALEKVAITRTAATLSVRLQGFDNTRTMNAIAFTWFHKDGSLIGGGPIVSVVESLVANYFRNYSSGGGWVAQFSFPVVSGSPESVTALEIEAFNFAGSTKAQRVTF